MHCPTLTREQNNVWGPQAHPCHPLSTLTEWQRGRCDRGDLWAKDGGGFGVGASKHYCWENEGSEVSVTAVSRHQAMDEGSEGYSVHLRALPSCWGWTLWFSGPGRGDPLLLINCEWLDNCVELVLYIQAQRARARNRLVIVPVLVNRSS